MASTVTMASTVYETEISPGDSKGSLFSFWGGDRNIFVEKEREEEEEDALEEKP